ncbi:MAG TPA: DHA2 family efflux MFS transporter permease subunit [Streptosporangiales bacterium]
MTTRWTSGQRWVVGLTAVAAAMVGLDALVVSTALSTIRVDIGASVEELEWTVNAYTLTFALLMMTASALGDRFGRRRLFAIGVGVFAAGSAACALAPDAGWLVAARAVQGVGAAAVIPLTLALLTAAISPPQRPRALGIYAAVMGASVPLGPLLGGAVVQGISWPWIFWLNVPLALALIPLALLRIDESRGPATALDVPGLVLVTGAVLGLVWGLVRGNSAGWTSREVLLSLTLGGFLVLAFVVREARAREPMLPMRLFRNRSFSAGNAAMFFLWGSALGAMFFMAQFLQTGLGFGPLDAGVRLVPWGAIVMLVPRVVAAQIPRLGERPFIAAGMVLHAAGMTWIALIAEPTTAYWEMVAPLLISGLGVAMASPAIQSAVLSTAASQDVGKSSGAFSTLRQLGGAFGVAVLVAVFAGAGSYASAPAFVDGVGPALYASAGLALAAAVAGLTLPGRRWAPAVEPAPAAAESSV